MQKSIAWRTSAEFANLQWLQAILAQTDLFVVLSSIVFRYFLLPHVKQIEAISVLVSDLTCNVHSNLSIYVQIFLPNKTVIYNIIQLLMSAIRTVRKQCFMLVLYFRDNNKKFSAKKK